MGGKEYKIGMEVQVAAQSKLTSCCICGGVVRIVDARSLDGAPVHGDCLAKWIRAPHDPKSFQATAIKDGSETRVGRLLDRIIVDRDRSHGDYVCVTVSLRGMEDYNGHLYLNMEPSVAYDLARAILMSLRDDETARFAKNVSS